MKSLKTFITATSIALLTSGVMAQAGDKKFMSAAEVKKAFAKGSITCSWRPVRRAKIRVPIFTIKTKLRPPETPTGTSANLRP